MNTSTPYTFIHSDKKKYNGLPSPIAPFPVPGCTGMEGQMQKTREDFHLLPSVQHDFHRSNFHEALILALRRFLLKNLCTEFHDNRTIQSLSLRQRRTDERTPFTKAFTFFTSKTTHTQRHVRLRFV